MNKKQKQSYILMFNGGVMFNGTNLKAAYKAMKYHCPLMSKDDIRSYEQVNRIMKKENTIAVQTEYREPFYIKRIPLLSKFEKLDILG